MNFLRAQIDRTDWRTRWRWRLRDNPRLAVERSRIEVGRSDQYSDQFRAVRLIGEAWVLISRHRKKTAAETALRKLEVED